MKENPLPRPIFGYGQPPLVPDGVNKVFVVTGHQGDRIADRISPKAVSVINNPDYQKGMLSSVRCGLQSLPAECEKVLVALGDQPAINTDLINQIIDSIAATDKGIIVMFKLLTNFET